MVSNWVEAVGAIGTFGVALGLFFKQYGALKQAHIDRMLDVAWRVSLPIPQTHDGYDSVKVTNNDARPITDCCLDAHWRWDGNSGTESKDIGEIAGGKADWYYLDLTGDTPAWVERDEASAIAGSRTVSVQSGCRSGRRPATGG